MALNVKGKTALITGASSGIGVDFARSFAARGANLILVARREEMLSKVAEQITKDHGVSVKIITQDLSVLGAGEKLEATLDAAGATVDILVNNAGFGTAGYLTNENRGRINQEIQLNVATLVDLTRAYLPKMLANNFGVIVNIASTASYQPVPGMAVYAATKAFVRSFTEAVWGEVKNPNVHVLAVSPGATESEFFDVAGAKPFGALMPASAVIDTLWAELDKKKPGPSVIVGGRNAFTAKLTSWVPKKAVINMAGSMFLPKTTGAK